MESLELIDDYFKGLLTDEQKRQFEKRVLSDPAFAEELAFYVNVGNTLKEQLIADKKERFRALYEQQQKTPDPRQSPVRRMTAFAVAAAVLLIVSGLWLLFLRQPGPERLADNYIRLQLHTLPVKMSSVQDSLQLAIGAYNDNDLTGALQQFEAILRRHNTDERATQYAGIVCLRLKEYDKALQYFQTLAADTALYSNPALFYESLTLMKRNIPGDHENARRLLQQVVDSNLARKEDAQRFLDKW
jgi:tetratricopeptide (TPR) repeat protein